MQTVPGVFWRTNDVFISELLEYLRGQRVLEVFSGNGYLASLLKSNNIDVKATSIPSGHDCHSQGFYTDVENIDAFDAVIRYGCDFDVLLMCWPTVTPQALRAAIAWGCQKPIVFIGEISNVKAGIYGGCATDAFFESTRIEHTFTSYKGNIIEIAGVLRLKEVMQH